MVTTEEIEHTLGEVYRLAKATSVHIEQPDLARIRVGVEELSGAKLFHNQITTENGRLIVPARRPESAMIMYFQLGGKCTFNLNHQYKVPERHHCLCYLPVFQSDFIVGEHKSFHGLSIQFKPDEVAAQLLEEGMSDDDWLRLLGDSDQPFSTVRESRPISLNMQSTVHQLLNCPYKGKFGQTYKDALIRLMLVEQLIVFRQDRQAMAVVTDTKLSRRDIDTLQAVKTYLDQHYLDELSLEKIVKLFGLNTFKLKYGFRKLFDTSVMRYIDDQKMAYARRLLLDEKQEVWTVADQLGYNHYTNFSTAFKRRFGYSPAQLKEQAVVS
ncbi:AraC family transcriptional regulator [Fibrisoma montanum]|uniref:AraC family transcriptional regulator n=1 Tax=Fibrisoma montanum TaxID=2305895 RepID=A0A418M6P6_9BACT|nr:AraC family transcriptional regulator [Fibrisoma montanum]RIV21534.1 AraC family transcriptional regulator [Fibrisoma montanum]